VRERSQVASGVPHLNKFFSIYFEPISKNHYAGGRLCHPRALWSGLASGHPPAKIVICAGTRLLAGVAPASTKEFRFRPSGLLSYKHV
jgi:hypothetical protein